MSHDTFMLLYTTFGAEADALTFSQSLLEKKLAGCTNCIGPMTSSYVWEGKLQTETEWALLIKTTGACIPGVMALLEEEHPYECPCLLEIPITGGYPPFLAFIKAGVAAN